MSVLELILIGVSLSMDAFAVSICAGLKMTKINYKSGAIIALFFGGFQALMPALGWLLGRLFASYVDKFDHWIAFGLLAFIGGKMIFDAVKGDESELGCDIKLNELFLLAVATSIDAFAVGVTFGLPGSEANIGAAAAIIGVTTFTISFGGVIIGNIFGAKWRNKAQVVGGVMLILVGLKLLFEGLGLI